MATRDFQTPFGPVRLWGEPAAFESGRPLVLAISGAFAIEDGPLTRLAPHLAAHADVLVAHLPGEHAPPLAANSVGVIAAALSRVLDEAFAGRPVVVCGVSVGALVALGLRASDIRGLVVVEPPLVAAKLWPLTALLRRKLAERPDDAVLASFVDNVFGVTPTQVRDLDYRHLIESLRRPTRVLIGGVPLFPERAPDPLPSLVDEPERALLRAHPFVRSTLVEGVGHNIPDLAGDVLVEAIRKLLQEVGLAGAWPPITRASDPAPPPVPAPGGSPPR
jgi:hypothetical protein